MNLLENILFTSHLSYIPSTFILCDRIVQGSQHLLEKQHRLTINFIGVRSGLPYSALWKLRDLMLSALISSWTLKINKI